MARLLSLFADWIRHLPSYLVIFSRTTKAGIGRARTVCGEDFESLDYYSVCTRTL